MKHIKYYFIINISDVTDEQYNASMEITGTVRLSLDGTKIILKSVISDINNPNCPFYNLNPLTHQEAINIMQSSEWSTGE